MSKRKQYIFIGIIAIIAIVGGYGYKEFNRKAVDLYNVQAQEIISSDSLIAAYEFDEVKANSKFLGKTLLVSGVIAEINNQQDSLLNIFLGTEKDMHKVSCLLDNNQLENIKKITVGNQISIKGICTGFLADVELNRCVILKDSKK
jgi:tRNA_anti-like